MKQAIVLASFGVSDPKQRAACIEPLADDIRRAFPAYEVYEAYTSAMIRRRLAASRVKMLSLEERLEYLAASGYTKVIVQPSHLTPGEEYDYKIRPAVQKFLPRFSVLQLGRPAFFLTGGVGQPDDYPRGLQAIWDTFSLAPGESLVLMGHGSPHRHNAVYERLQQAADEAHLPIHIGVLEEGDTPTLETVIKRLQCRGINRVLLAPLLLVGGVHTAEDMAGKQPSSWKNRLQAADFVVRLHLQGLGGSASFRLLYVEHLQELIF